MRGIQQTETIHEVANVVTKLCFPLSHVVLFVLVASWLVYLDTLSSVNVNCSDIFEEYFKKFQEILSEKILGKIF